MDVVMMRQLSLANESDFEALVAFVRELRLLARNAKARGDKPVQLVMGGCSSDYWYGVQFGYEDVAQRMEDLLWEAE